MPIEIVNGAPNRVPYDTGEGSQVNGTRSEPSVEQKESGKSTTHDTVSLTDTATNLQKINQAVNELPVVDSQRTAEKMIGFETALGDSGP